MSFVYVKAVDGSLVRIHSSQLPQTEQQWSVTVSDMPKGAEAVSKNLDLLIELDEPEQFVWAAVQATSGKPRWVKVHAALIEIEKKLAAANEPSPKTATEEAPAT